jgi:hypothetical protein
LKKVSDDINIECAMGQTGRQNNNAATQKQPIVLCSKDYAASDSDAGAEEKQLKRSKCF